jgi:hypothetical protein
MWSGKPVEGRSSLSSFADQTTSLRYGHLASMTRVVEIF